MFLSTLTGKTQSNGAMRLEILRRAQTMPSLFEWLQGSTKQLPSS